MILVQGQLGQKQETLSEQQTKRKRTGGMVHLPDMYEALGSITSTTHTHTHTHTHTQKLSSGTLWLPFSLDISVK
jgi:hypothetical protein